MGGAYYLFNLLLCHAMAVVAAVLYSAYHEGPGKIADAVLFPVVCGMIVLWALSFGWFLRMIDPQYLRTFWSLESGAGCAMRRFLEAQDDEKRALIFTDNRLMWEPIYDD